MAEQVQAILAQHDKLFLNQHASLLEAVSQGCCEKPNRYSVHSEGKDGPLLLNVVEESDCCPRMCCAPMNSLFLNISVPDSSETLLRIERPGCLTQKPCLCCCACTDACLDEMTIHEQSAIKISGEQLKVGAPELGPTAESAIFTAKQAPASQAMFNPIIKIYPKGSTEEDMQIKGPCCFGGCSELCCDSKFEATNKSGEVIGRVKKTRPAGIGECITEACTDADRFEIMFEGNVTDQQKLGMFTGALLADFMLFEQDNGMCSLVCPMGADGSRDCGIKFTLFMCYCCGCLQPCTVTCLAGGEGGEGGDE